MGGPIIRSGASPEFSKNWDSIFGKKSGSEKSTAKKDSGKAVAAKATKKPAKKGKK